MLSECLAERCLQQVKSFRCDTAVWPLAQANSIREWWRPLTQSLLRTLGIPRTWEKSSLSPPVVVSARYVHLCRSCNVPQDTYVWLDYSSIPQRHTLPRQKRRLLYCAAGIDLPKRLPSTRSPSMPPRRPGEAETRTSHGDFRDIHMQND